MLSEQKQIFPGTAMPRPSMGAYLSDMTSADDAPESSWGSRSWACLTLKKTAVKQCPDGKADLSVRDSYAAHNHRVQRWLSHAKTSTCAFPSAMA